MKSKIIYIILTAAALLSCEKQDRWLDKKANKSDIVPTTIADFQLIMNNTDIMNDRYGSYGTISSDNFYITYANWQSAFSNAERNAYVWATEIYEGGNSIDWDLGYQRIVFSNIVLDGLAKIAINQSNQAEWNRLKGTALFYRGLNFFELVQTFSKAYDINTSKEDLGIVLRLTSDINEKSVRASVQKSYDQLLSDLLAAEPLLPQFPQLKTQPSKIAVHGVLSRIFLCMGNYEKAHHYADLALKAYSDLIDFNTLSTTQPAPFPTFQLDNREVLFYCTGASWGSTNFSRLRVDENLYASYVNGDLRKLVFYNNNGNNGIAFKGTYTGVTGVNFYGVAVNELYLIRAEASAGLRNASAATEDLNTLLRTRWNKNSTYPVFETVDADVAMAKILDERRKEIPFWGARRWQDLKRLNKMPAFQKTLTRNLNGTIYTLPPNDPRYVYALPDIEIRLNGLPQNKR
ncbi:RagB/SusD family nutrient uptake outer membrane protein [Flavobacterium lindanitolerans]|uniref:RagB/SusD family nutrient uptake outer membrane protein n=1 Tax=Flavobacterium lindanitolerans TaxID=428988 RepID=UPI0023F4390E|nr:RagB/SusD family nutrient uptake outer membrane protein [Flavobacterium lindanitolerans]